SVELTHFEGSTISKAPKNDAANTRKSVKNSRFGIQCVLSVFANPAPALVSDTIMPSDEQRSTIERPNISALPIAEPFDPPPCEKNATVIGIIGKTHGVSIPARPASIERRKNFSKPLPDLPAGVSVTAPSSEAETSPPVAEAT